MGTPDGDNLVELPTLALYESETSNWAAEAEGGVGDGGEVWPDSGAWPDVVDKRVFEVVVVWTAD